MKTIGHNSIFLLLLLWIFGAGRSFAHSQSPPDTLILTHPVDSFIDLTSYATVLVDSTASLSWEEAQEKHRAGDFFPLDSLQLESKFVRGRYDYWLYFVIKNQMAEPRPATYLEIAHVDSLLIHVIEADTVSRLITAGKRTFDLYDRSELPFCGKSDIPFSFAPQETYTFLVRLNNENSFPGKLQPLLVNQTHHAGRYEEGYRYYYTFFGGFFTLLLFLTVFALAQYFQNRDKAFLFYALYIFTLFLFYLREYDMRNLFDYVFPLFIHDHRFYSVFSISIYISYFLFIDYFLVARQRFPWLHRFIRWSVAVFVAFIMVDQVITTFDPLLSWKIIYGFRILISLVSLGILIWLLQTKDRLALYIVIGSLMLLIGNLTTIAVTVLEVFEESWWDKTQIPAFIGIVAELLFFSTVLGYRQRLAEKEKARVKKELFRKESEATYLKKMSQIKTNFFTNITHEFRTPLTVIQGMADELKGNEKARSLILQNSNRLLNLVNQLLDLSKVESGSMPLNLIQSNIINYLSYLTESLHSLAFAKKISLSFYSELDTLYMDFDPEKIQRIVINLISNAIKFTPEYGKVLVVGKKQQREKDFFFVLEVKDTGTGIPEEQRPHIFDRFFQAPPAPLSGLPKGREGHTGSRSDKKTNSDKSPSEKRREQSSALHSSPFGEGRPGGPYGEGPGSGIGLSLVKELTEMHGGAIEVESEVGRGTTFTLTFPISRNAEKAQVGLPDIQGKSTIPFPVSSAPDEAPAKQMKPLSSDKGKPRLLIIEDNYGVIQYLRTILAGTFSIQVARNGRTGIEKALSEIPDIIISDVMMPEKDGFELCRTLKQDERSNHIPIILLTAKATVADKVEGLSFGADAYLMKPFQKEELLVRLQQLLELRRKLQQKYQSAGIEGPEPEDPFLQRIRQIIKAHLDDPDFTVERLSREVGMSRVQVHRKLKALTNRSASHHIKMIRLNKARELLKNPELNISEVAYRVGYNDPAYFSRVFSKAFGVTPSEVRG